MSVKTFIRFTEVEAYDPEDMDGCITIPATETCGEVYDTPILGKQGDIIKWQMNKFDLPETYQPESWKIGIINECGEYQYFDIGTITEGTNNMLLCTASLPIDIPDACYRLGIYVDFVVADCSQFAGSTVQDLIDSGLKFGDTLHCLISDWY